MLHLTLNHRNEENILYELDKNIDVTIITGTKLSTKIRNKIHTRKANTNIISKKVLIQRKKNTKNATES